MTSARVSVTINDCRSSDKSFVQIICVQIPQVGVCSAEIVNKRGIIARPLGNIARQIAHFAVLDLEFPNDILIFRRHVLRPVCIVQLFVDARPNRIILKNSLRRLAA